jgi:cadmium resistance protein CadD (predicted permease)
MTDVIRLAATAAGLYVATNLDNLVILVATFVLAERQKFPLWKIVVGQYVGFLIILIVSTVGAAFFSRVPHQLIGLVGLAPITIGTLGFIRSFRLHFARSIALPSVGVLPVVLFTLANGGDNVSTYAAVLDVSDFQCAVLLEVFLLAFVGPWCLLAYCMSRAASILPRISRVWNLAVPAVLVSVGVAILIANDTVGWIWTHVSV